MKHNSLAALIVPANRPMAQRPGAAFDYNSGNSHLLSAILSRRTGHSALEFARRQLFKPLGITDVAWRHDPQGVSTGGFGLYMTSMNDSRSL